MTDLQQVTQQTSNETKSNNNDYYTEYEIQEKKAAVVQTGLTESDLCSKNTMNQNGNEVNLEMEYNDDIVPEYSSTSESSDEEEEYNKGTLTMPKMPIKFLIIDFSPINFIDTVGVKTVRQVIIHRSPLCLSLIFLSDFYFVMTIFSSLMTSTTLVSESIWPNATVVYLFFSLI
jgi:hypothetical protein